MTTTTRSVQRSPASPGAVRPSPSRAHRPAQPRVQSAVPLFAQRCPDGPPGCCAACDGRLQRSADAAGGAAGEFAPDVAPVLAGLGPGRPLEPSVAARVRPHYPRVLADVRIHTGEQAAASARALGAAAYTAGRDIVFGHGRYAPETPLGMRLLAHELAHVVQQAAGAATAPAAGVVDDPRLEADAERMARAVVEGGEPTPALSSGAPGIARQSLADERRATPAPPAQPTVLSQLPVTFVAIELPPLAGPSPAVSVPGRSMTTLGLGANVLASGDTAWLARGAAARRILSPGYWAPMLPSPGTLVLDRVVNELPRDLGPLIETNALPWLRRGFTADELASIPELVARLNRSGVSSLSTAELAMLRRAAEIHIGGTTPGTPFASYMLPDAPAPNVGPRQFRVRVEMPRSGALDVSGPNAFNEMGALQGIENSLENELMVVANQEGRIIHVQPATTSAESGALMRSSGALRWGGRVLVVAGLGVSAYRIGSATAAARPRVVGEEVGGQVFGALGMAAGAAGCVALGVATAGVGLFLCGLAGGVVLGVGGSAAGGAAGEALFGGVGAQNGRPMTDAEHAQTNALLGAAAIRQNGVCPSCHTLRSAAELRGAFSSFPALAGASLDVPSSAGHSSAGQLSVTLTFDDLRRIRAWLGQ